MLTKSVENQEKDVGETKKYLLLHCCILLIIILLYRDVFISVFENWLRYEEESHGIILAGLAVFLLFNRRQDLAHWRSKTWWPGFGLLLVAVCLYLGGFIAVEYYSGRLSFVLLAAGVGAFLYGPSALRSLALPLLVLALAIPLPAIIVNQITLPLKLVISSFSTEILRTCGVAVFLEGNILQLPGITLEVVNACSGIRSIFSLLVMAILLAIELPVWWKKIVLVAACIPVAVMANTVRITTTGLLINRGEPDAALGFYHGFSGWLLFLVSLLILYGLQRFLDGESSGEGK